MRKDIHDGKIMCGVGGLMQRHLFWILAAISLLAAASSASERKWEDRTGRYSVEAELVEVKHGKVWLKKCKITR